MNMHSIAQDYYTLVIDDKGNMPALRQNDCNAGLVTAALMDLQLAQVLMLDGKNIRITAPLPDALAHLAPLYDYLAEKERTTQKLMSDFCLTTRAHLKPLIAAIGGALASVGCATEEAGVPLGNRPAYVPTPAHKHACVTALKEATNDMAHLSDHDAALLWILSESKNLKQYFSKYESSDLKAALKKLKDDPQNVQLAKILQQADDMTSAIAAVMLLTLV